MLTSADLVISSHTLHSIIACFCTTMSDPGRPLESCLKGKSRALVNQFSESRRPFNDNPSTGSRLGSASDFHNCAFYSDEIFIRLPEITSEGTALVRVHFGLIKFLFSHFMGHQNVLPGAHNFVIKGSNLYSAQKVCLVMMVVSLRY